MAPEQACGDSKSVGPAADTYALGAILYECLTGRPPFVGDSPIDVMLAVTSDEPQRPTLIRKRIPRDLETICLKCLEKEPRQRYCSSLALAEDLRRFLDHEPTRARPIRPSERLVRWFRRRPIQTTVMAAIVVLVVAASALGHQHRAERKRREESLAAVRDLLDRGREAMNNKAPAPSSRMPAAPT
jgi:serine/threonine protein kinase